MSKDNYEYLVSLFPNNSLNMTQIYKASKDGFGVSEFH